MGGSLEREKPPVGMSLITPALLSCKLLLTSVVGNMQPDVGTRSGVEQLVCRMYQPKTDIKTVKALSWSLFKKNQAESERLPPTQAALHQAILRDR